MVAIRKAWSAPRWLLELARAWKSELNELRSTVARLRETVDELQSRIVRPASVYLGENIAVARTIYGHRIFVDSRDVGLAIHLLTEGNWESWIAKRFETELRPGATVIEVGANVGYYTLLGASRIGPGGRYYAFEANPHISRLLTWSLDINGFRDRVTLFSKLAYSDHRRMPFHVLERYPGSSSIHAFSDQVLNDVRDHAKVMEVEAVPLDDVFADEAFQVDLIKVDAEGSEPHVFRGMERLLRRSPRVKIICEFNPRMIGGSEPPAQFIDFIQRLGFRFYRIENPSGELTRLEKDQLLNASHIEVLMSRE